MGGWGYLCGRSAEAEKLRSVSLRFGVEEGDAAVVVGSEVSFAREGSRDRSLRLVSELANLSTCDDMTRRIGISEGMKRGRTTKRVRKRSSSSTSYEFRPVKCLLYPLYVIVD